MAEIAAIAMTEVLSSNIAGDNKAAIFTFKTIKDKEQSIAMPIPQLLPLIELAMIELRRSGVGAGCRCAGIERMECRKHGCAPITLPSHS